MVDVRAVGDADNRDDAFLIVDPVPDTVMPAPCRPVAMEGRDQWFSYPVRVLPERPCDELPGGEGD
jgi:hypothetical protein